jgi:hypothetical protein
MDRPAGHNVSAKSCPRPLNERERALIERRLQYEEQPRTLWGDDLQRIARIDENAMSKETKDREAADNATAAANRDARFAALTAGLALKADELDAAMRSAGIDRGVYRQVGHACRALHIGVKMLTTG